MNTLNIPHQRTCNCPPNHLNCLTAKEWLKAQIGIWEFDYVKSDREAKKVHPAVYPAALAKRCIEVFTHQGELVLDPFCGTGTTLEAAQALGRNAVGFELNQKYAEYAKARLAQLELTGTQQVVLCEDARNAVHYLPAGSVALVVTSPPYADMLNKVYKGKSRRRGDPQKVKRIKQYSQDDRDLGTLPVDAFTKELAGIFDALRPAIRPSGNIVINTADPWQSGRRAMLPFHIAQALSQAGFTMRNVIIWDKRSLVNNAGIFGWPKTYVTVGASFEYLLHFVKEG